MKKKLLYILNPVSGSADMKNIDQIINRYTDNNLFDFEISFTEYSGHAYQLAKKAVSLNYDLVVAVGGDGTVNEIGKAVKQTDTILGIIPKGSGNGLARFLNIPLKTRNAVKLINTLNYSLIDTVNINEFSFLNVAGTGFDAHIAHLFKKSEKRGFRTYTKLVLQEFHKFSGQNYRLKVDGRELKAEQVFMLSLANSSQFGNNAHIAPNAKINDGLIDLCILKKFPDFHSLDIIYKLYTRSLTKSKFYETYKAKKIEIVSDIDLLGHIDGEAVNFKKNIIVEIVDRSLKIISGYN